MNNLDLKQYFLSWRLVNGIKTRRKAAVLLGISPRTVESIEQGNGGFKNTKLLTLAMKQVTNEIHNNR